MRALALSSKPMFETSSPHAVVLSWSFVCLGEDRDKSSSNRGLKAVDESVCSAVNGMSKSNSESVFFVKGDQNSAPDPCTLLMPIEDCGLELSLPVQSIFEAQEVSLASLSRKKGKIFRSSVTKVILEKPLLGCSDIRLAPSVGVIVGYCGRCGLFSDSTRMMSVVESRLSSRYDDPFRGSSLVTDPTDLLLEACCLLEGWYLHSALCLL